MSELAYVLTPETEEHHPVDAAARPVRVEGGTDVDPFRVAERAYSRGAIRDAASIPATSVSISIQY